MQEMQETQVRSLGQEDPLEEEMAIHSSILAWRNSMDWGVWQATVHEVTKIGLDWVHETAAATKATDPQNSQGELAPPDEISFCFAVLSWAVIMVSSQ